jgi:hypothetical protein
LGSVVDRQLLIFFASPKKVSKKGDPAAAKNLLKLQRQMGESQQQRNNLSPFFRRCVTSAK